ncbi:MAG: zinc ribbon domain-containing protein [Chloroflexi bacterium]|nr:zinc ribbon domain-containing protein [Chloroflexota bacterium]
MTDYVLLAVMVFVLLSAVAPFVLLPFRRRVLTDEALERERSVLLARREAVINALRELDLDYAVGKLPEADYQRQRQALLKEGAAILKALDALEQRARTSSRAASSDLDARLEALIAQRREQRQPAPAPEAGAPASGSSASPIEPSVDDLIESLLHQRLQTKEGRFVGFCPHCGAPVMEHDRFCARCGQPLSPLDEQDSKRNDRRRKRRSKRKR